MPIKLIYLDILAGETQACSLSKASEKNILGIRVRVTWNSSHIVNDSHIWRAPQTQSHSGWTRRVPRLTIFVLIRHHLETILANRYTMSKSMITTVCWYYIFLIWICQSSLKTLSTHSVFRFDGGSQELRRVGVDVKAGSLTIRFGPGLRRLSRKTL